MGFRLLCHPDGPLGDERPVGVVIVERERIVPELLECPGRACPYGPPPDAPLDQRRVRIVEHEFEDTLAEVGVYRIIAPTRAPYVEGIPVPPETLRVVDIRVYVNVGEPGIDAPDLVFDIPAPFVAGGVAILVDAAVGLHRERHEAGRY